MNIDKVVVAENNKPTSFGVDLYEATDWEVVEDDSEWNLAEQSITVGHSYNHTTKTTDKLIRYTPEDVKKCRDLIIKDLATLLTTENTRGKCWAVAKTVVEKRFGDLE